MNNHKTALQTILFLCISYLVLAPRVKADEPEMARLNCHLYFVSNSEWITGENIPLPYPVSESKEFELLFTEYEKVVELRQFTITSRVFTGEEAGMYLFVTVPNAAHPLIEISRDGKQNKDYEYPTLRMYDPETEDRLDLTCTVKAGA